MSPSPPPADRLFEVEAPVTVDLSTADRRLTARRRADLARGQHPLMGGPLHPTATCGDCIHRHARHFAKTYWKCDLVRMSHSAASDIRLSWPACSRYEPEIHHDIREKAPQAGTAGPSGNQ